MKHIWAKWNRQSLKSVCLLPKQRSKDDGATQQINGREGETAAFIWRSSVSLTLRVGGFAPRHLSRYVALGELRRKKMDTEIIDNSNSSAWRWWESRRLRYNIGLVAGFSAFVLYLLVYFAFGNKLPMEIDVTIFTVIFQAVGYVFYILAANVFYCLGALSERLPRMRSVEEHRKTTFALGFWLSVALPFAKPLLLASYAFSHSKA